MARIVLQKVYSVLLLQCLLTASSAFGQQPPWHRIGTSQGFPDATVTCLHRTDQGVLYAGTHDGIVVMTGPGFNRITTTSDEGSQVNPFINCIVTSRNGTVYAGSRNSIWRYDPARKQLTTLMHPWGLIGGIADIRLAEDSGYLLAATTKGILKISLRSAGLAVTDSIANTGAMRIFRVGREWYAWSYRRTLCRIQGRTLQVVFSNPAVRDMVRQERYHRWVLLLSDGLATLAPGEKTPVQHPLSLDWRNLPEIPLLFADRQDNLLLQFADGAVLVDGSSLDPVKQWPNEPGNEFSPANNSIVWYHEDPFGVHWLATNGAGICYNPVSGGTLEFLASETLNCTTVWSTCLDRGTGLLWAGTDHGLRYGPFNARRGTGPKMLVPAGEKKFAVTGIQPYDSSSLLICTFGNGCWLAGRHGESLRPLHGLNKRLQSLNIYSALRFAPGKWLITTQGEAVTWEPAGNRIAPFLTDRTLGHFNLSACITPGGNLLCCTGSGLCLTDLRGVEKAFYQNNPADTSSLSSNVVVWMQPLRDGRIALGTMGGGLCLFDPARGRFRKLKLVTNPANVYGIAEPSPGVLLATTSNGLCLYRLHDGTSSMLNRKNVLPFNDFNQFALSVSGNLIFAGGETGVVILRVSGLDSLFNSVEKIVIRLGDRITTKLILPPGRSSVDLHIGLLNDLPHKNIKFRYRLEGFESGWHDLAAGPDQVIYPNLPPGDYILSVSAQDPNGVFCAEPASFPITAEPLFWQTTWFRLATGLLLLAGLVLLVRYLSQIRLNRKLKRLEDEQKLARERARISRELHDNVGSQLTYIISGLEASGILLERNEREKAASGLARLQESARESMQQLRQAIWTLNHDEITLEDLGNQFRKWFDRILEPHPQITPKFSSEPGPNPVLDPLRSLNLFRMMQEAVHNAIRHAGPCTLEVRIGASGEDVTVTIRDDGNGFTPGGEEGSGMGSLRTRSEEAGIRLELNSAPGNGTTVRLELSAK